MQKLELKNIMKTFYSAKPAPIFLKIPAMNFLMIDGTGNPNTAPEYADAVQALYSVAYTLKFKIKKELQIDYPVMALEGLWWTPDMQLFSADKKDDWLWTMMISVPEIITEPLVISACAEAERKHNLLALSRLHFEPFNEGLSAQILHIGPYADEAINISKLHEFIHSNGYTFDGLLQKHHEIYLSDPRKTAPEKLKTIIRQPVKE